MNLEHVPSAEFTSAPSIASADTLDRLYELCPSLRAIETQICHRIQARSFLGNYIPEYGVGAELGVFTGLFSKSLLKLANPKSIYLVDPWWTKYGTYYPDWGLYTDYGRLPCDVAYTAAKTRTSVSARNRRVNLIVSTSQDWLASLPDDYLDWVYLDASHNYDETVLELHLIAKKLKRGGVVLGDDWETEPGSVGFGVYRAVNNLLASAQFDVLFAGLSLQWGLRRR